jgi:integrase/recombinase XerD
MEVTRHLRQQVRVVAQSEGQGMSDDTFKAVLIPHAEPDGPSVTRLVGSFLAGYASVETRRAYAGDLRCYLGFLRMHQVDPLAVRRPVVETYMRELEARGLANNTRGRRLSTLKSWYGFLWDEGFVPGNPAGRVKGPRRDKPVLPALNRHEAHRFAKAAEEDRDPYTAAALHLMLFCGLRVSEACSRDVSDLETVNYSAVLNVRGKGDKQRRAELPPRVVSAVRGALDGREVGPLLLNQGGRRVNRTNVQRMIWRVSARADVSKRLTPHCLRRSFIQIALDSGAPLRDVQRASGHASAETTTGYDRREFELGRSPSYGVQIAVA